MSLFSPLKIKLILHIYYSIARPIEHRDAPAVRDAIEDFLECGLTEHYSGAQSGFKITAKGKAWVKMICNTPLPITSTEWIDPRTEEVIK